MKTIIITILLCCSWTWITAQPNYIWAKQLGGGNANLSKSRLDTSGNIYITGEFTNTGIFGNTTLTASGSSDIYISKLEPDGNFIWIKQIGGNAIIRSHDIALDPSGNIYITGYFTGTVDFDPGAGNYNLTTNSTVANPGSDIFICKLDNNGNFLWAGQMGGTTGDLGNAVATDPAGDVYITGSFTGTADFDPGIGATEVFYLNTNGDYADGFICKLNAAGNLLWAYNLTETGYGSGRSVCTDDGGHVYIAGEFTGTVDFDPGTGTANFTSSNNTSDAFIVKLTASGGFVFARQTGGTGIQSHRDIFVDSPGNIYTTGAFTGTNDFDPGTTTYALTSASGNSDIYISKLDESGNFLWARQIVDTNQVTSSGGNDILTDAYGNVYVIGDFDGTCDFDPGPGVFQITSNGADDFFILKLDAAGNYGWALAIGGPLDNRYDQGHSINMDRTGAIITSGRFSGTVDFDPGPGTANLTATSGNYNHFLLKLKPCEPDTFYVNHTVCNSFTYNNQTYYQSGTYIHSFLDTLGCDSIVLLNLTIQPFNYSSGMDTLYTHCFATTYQLQPSGIGINDYLWNDNSTHNFRVVDSQGLYWVTYEKAGCIVQTDSFFIYFNSPELHVDNSCNGQPTAKARITQQNTDTNTYTYTWYNAAQQVISTIDSIINQPSGNYSVHIRNYSGCDTVINFTIEEDHYRVAFAVDSIACEEALIPFINTSDHNFISFHWDFGDGSFSNELHPEHRYDSGSIYEIMLAGTAGVCTDTLYKNIIIDARHQVQFATDKYAICTGEAIKFTPHSADSTLITYNWQLGNSNSFTTTSDIAIVHAYDEPGIYPVTLIAKFRACQDTSFADTVKVHPFPLVHLGPDSVICLKGTAVTLQNHHPDIEGYRYLWNTGATTQGIEVVHGGYYSLTVTNEYSCAATQQVRVDKDCYANIPNAFTPNGDDVNDYFYPRQLLSRGVISFRMQVFSRWGEKVFATTLVDGRGWDGRFGGKEQPDGVYVYVIEVQLDNGSQERYEGNVTLIR